MSSSRRSKFEIWAEVLELCLREKRTQTWLLRETRLKTKAIKQTLQFLLSRNLIVQLNDEDNRNFNEKQTLNLPFMKEKENKILGIEHTPSLSFLILP
jgi:hypothetical protein